MTIKREDKKDKKYKGRRERERKREQRFKEIMKNSNEERK